MALSHKIILSRFLSSVCTRSLFCCSTFPVTHFFTLNRGVKSYVREVKTQMKKRKDAMGPQPIQPRNTYIEWNHSAELFAFGKRLGEDFDKDLLQRAFIERSYVIMEEEKQKKVGIDEPEILLQDNSEFRDKGGRLIADFAVRYLRTVFPRFPEEGICSVCDYLLSDEVLADISKNIGTSDIILTSQHPPATQSLANVLKAIVYALELSSGKNRAEMFIRDFIITYLSGKDINELWEIKNPERVLESILERDGRSKVEARLIGEAGRGTILSAFQVGLYCGREFIGMGFGESVSVAHEIAVKDALKRLFQTTERAKPIPFDLTLTSSNEKPFANISIQDWCEKNVKAMVMKG